MFELSVLPADVDGQTFTAQLGWISFTVFGHFLCFLCVLHLDKTLGDRKHQSDTLNTYSAVLLLFKTQLVLVFVLYLSLQPVGEILLDSPKWLGQFQDGVI